MSVKIYRAVYIYGSNGDFSFSRWVTLEGQQSIKDELAAMADANAGEDVTDPVIIGWEQMELEEDSE